jgi:hypothetical protein
VSAAIVCLSLCASCSKKSPRQLEKQTWLTDLDERQHSLGAKQSLLEMAAVVQSQSE